MTSEQQQRVRDLFEQALDVDPSQAASWVSSRADDPAVKQEVLSLLEHHSRAGAFLQEPIVDRLPELLASGEEHDEDAEPLAPGAVIGTYTIVRELGRGGMGHVYLATDGRLGRTVALKALAPRLVRDASQRERLRREARAAASLTHPGICTVYALEDIDGELYIVTEFVDGHTLREEIRSGQRPSVDMLTRTARELAAALASAHARGIVHRDLKPENIMRTRDGRLKILDFGLARGESSPEDVRVTHTGVMVGTPAYMAPEQLHRADVDARADVFAYGVVMYEYACGMHPVRASAPLSAPASLADVFARCLREAPAERFANGSQIVDALDQSGDVPSSPHASWWRIHQLVIGMLYIAAATLAWQIKEWLETPVTVALFIALGAGATVGGVLRGHLVFTERMNRRWLPWERRRTGRAMLLLDLLMCAMLFADGVLIASHRALPAVGALSLALGIVLAALVLEPATTTAAFGGTGEE
jgi:serine/threonine-protein kinase